MSDQDSAASAEVESPRTAKVKALLRQTLAALVTLARADSGSAEQPEGSVPTELADALNRALARADGGRDALLIIFAFRLVEGRPIDISNRIDGDRAVSDYLGKELYPDLGIAGVDSAMQNRSFTHGYLDSKVRNPAVRTIGPLVQDAEVSDEVIRGVYWALARGIAATAKTFKPLPVIDLRSMTFQRVFPLVAHLLSARGDREKGSGTGGAHEQFLFAALLQAVHDDEGARLRVVTKSLTGADRSAQTAADVQVILGQARLVEAYEVSANNWESKMDKAAGVLVEYPELERVHIVANAAGASPGAVWAATEQAARRVSRQPESLDITVSDVRGECLILLSRASQRGRRAAIQRFHEHLIHLQNDMTLPNELVEKCRELGLVEEGG